MHDYTKHPDLAELLLEESYVLDVEATPARLVLSMEFALTEKHPDYREPGPDAYLCYRRGTLSFGGVTSVAWTQQGTPPSRDVTGELDYGNIDYLRFDDVRYEFGGDVGQFAVEAQQVSVALARGDSPDA